MSEWYCQCGWSGQGEHSHEVANMGRQRKVLLRKEGQCLYDVPFQDVQEYDSLGWEDKFDYHPFALVSLKYQTPQGRWFVVMVEDVAKCFPRRWRPA